MTDSLEIFAFLLSTEPEKCHEAFWRQLTNCDCWLCDYYSTYFDNMPKHVPAELLNFIAWRSFMHFTLYSWPNCDLN